MRKRNHRIVFYLSDQEYEHLTKMVKETRQPRERFLRMMLGGLQIKAAPPVDVPVLIREVRRVGYNIDHLLKRANSQGFIDAPLLRDALNENCEVSRKIVAAYTTKEQ